MSCPKPEGTGWAPSLVVRGFVAPTDHGWYQFLRARPELTEVNFWRPSGRVFNLAPGAPFFFKLKRRHNAIGGFGLFARAQRLPVWRAWDVFGPANGTKDEHHLLMRLDRLGGADTLGLGRNRPIGCVAITEPVFFTPDEWVAVPSGWSRNIVSGRAEDLTRGDGLRMWKDCLERAVARDHGSTDWAREAIDAQRAGRPVLITPRLGQSSFRLAVLEAYGQQCAVTTEHSIPVIDAAHIRPWAAGGTHSIPNGVPLGRDLHRLFDLGYVTIRTDMRLAVSGKLRDDYANGRAYYELDGREIHLPDHDAFRPDTEALAWHQSEVYLGG